MSAHGRFQGNSRQRRIIECALKCADEEKFLTYDRLLEMMPELEGISRQAVMCSVGHIERWGFLRRVREKDRTMTIRPTLRAYEVFRREPER